MRKILSLLLVAACGKSADAPVFQANVPPPARGFQLVGPELDIPPGQEQMWCTPFPALDHDTTVVEVQGFQASGGHHLALFTLTKDFKPGAYRCDGSDGAVDMTTWRFVDSAPAGKSHTMPDGVALVIPAGRTLMLQSHYVAGKDPIRVKDVFNVSTGDPAKNYIEANYWALGDTGIQIPQGAYQTHGNCTIDSTINVIDILGHQHQYGDLFQLDLARAAGGTQEIYHQTDGPLMRNDPPRVDFPVDAPLALKPGDSLRYTCGWNNTTDHTMEFPEEMCQGMLLYYPSKGFVVCDSGTTSVVQD